MRRALVGTVPDEILNRRRKAFVSRGALFELKASWSDLTRLDENLASSKVGIVDPTRFTNAVHGAQGGKETPVVPILRALALEFWLRSLRNPKNIRHQADQSPLGCCTDAMKDGFTTRFSWLKKQKSKTKGGESHDILKAGNRSLGKGH
jgi:hypothetical protein